MKAIILIFLILAASSCVRVNEEKQRFLLDYYRTNGQVDGLIDLPIQKGGRHVERGKGRTQDINLGISMHGWCSINGRACATKDIVPKIKRLIEKQVNVRLLVWQDYRCSKARANKLLSLIVLKELKSYLRIHWNEKRKLVGTKRLMPQQHCLQL